jgi:site-specific DNA-methyltransferase (adenine-specific)
MSLQQAGFNVGFSSIYWTYSEGFPKAENIGKAVDKRLGKERQQIERNPNSRENCDKSNTLYESGTVGKTAYITEPCSEEAKTLDGSYGGFQPKPAVEVIIVAMKPLSERTYVDQALKNGHGISWLDDGRIPTQDNLDGGTYGGIFSASRNPDGSLCKAIGSGNQGRFPANLLVSDDILNDGRIIKASGDKNRDTEKEHNEIFLSMVRKGISHSPSGDGSFSRYFDLDKWWAKTFPFFIVSKPSKGEKNKWCDNLEGTVRSSSQSVSGQMMPTKDHTPHKIKGNFHPTTKPVKLFTYLVTIGSRPNNVILEPFAGSGTTALACQILNRECIAIDNNREYCDITIERLKHPAFPITDETPEEMPEHKNNERGEQPLFI